LEAYCVKCKSNREIIDPRAEFNARGTPVTIGICEVCGTKLYRMGGTPAHTGMIPPDKKVIEKRSGKLVIVESPAKAKTVGNFLGKGYTVRASVGHVRDLLRSQLSVDVENDFAPKYRVPNEKKAVVKELTKEAKTAEEIFLATDPDREGEAIAWHLIEAANLPKDHIKRVVFHEITRTAVDDAFNHPRAIDMDLVNAQQGRRILDRLVGYSLSPLLWEKVRSRLSAGRVQSVALRLIVEREREIQRFIPEEYWSIDASLKPNDKKDSFTAHLVKIEDQEIHLSSKNAVDEILSDLEQAEYLVSKVKKGERRKKPSAPFITSTLQQQASRQLGYTARRTMMIAQQLYEGVDVGEGGTSGLITYMRTDSVHVSSLAVEEVRKYIKEFHGKAFLPEVAPQHKTRAAVAQEAHEAIRPTSVFRTPEAIKIFLKPEQYKLYQLIWRRFVASQMEAAMFDTLTVEVTAVGQKQQYLFRTSGSSIKFAGFTIVYEEAHDDDVKAEDEGNIRIPMLDEGEKLKLIKLLPEQHFTQPPPRYSEASLVQILEEYGIGRPSTYAPILTTIQARGYVLRENKRLFPTETGFLVNDLMIEFFPEILGVHFTAKMESDLDKVASGERRWQEVMRDFYVDFEPQLKHAKTMMPETKTEPEKIGRACPDCGSDLVVRWGRYGKFISCSAFPKCRYTEALLEKIGVLCPKDGGDLVVRKTRKGRIFYACSNYPNCDFTSWKRPLEQACPNCGGLLVEKNKNEAACLKCEETIAIELLPVKSETA